MIAKLPGAVANFIRLNRSLLLFLLLMTVFRSSVADWNIVPTGSMIPTIIEGDRIHVDKLAYDLQVPLAGYSLRRLGEPSRGVIIVFNSDAANLRLVKRVIGVPGDVIAMHNNRIYVNDRPARYRPLTTPYTPAGTRCFTESLPDHSHPVCVANTGGRFANFGPVVVGKDEYLILGDNRDNSADFRVHGFARRHELVGRAKNVVLSHDPDNAWLPRSSRIATPLDTDETSDHGRQ